MSMPSRIIHGTHCSAAQKRRFILNELLNTERDYIRDMRAIMEVGVAVALSGKSPLFACTGLQCGAGGRHGRGEAHHIFQSRRYFGGTSSAARCTRSQPQLHNDFLALLETCLSTDVGKVGELFERTSSRFLLYTEYYTNHPESLSLLQARPFSVHPPVRDACAGQRCGSRVQGLAGGVPGCARTPGPLLRHRCTIDMPQLPLADYLLKPVQRLLKYPLLLKVAITTWAAVVRRGRRSWSRRRRRTRRAMRRCCKARRRCARLPRASTRLHHRRP